MKVKQLPGFDQGRGLDADGLRLDRARVEGLMDLKQSPGIDESR